MMNKEKQCRRMIDNKAEYFRKRTIEILYEIDNVDILVKIFTCAKTHLEILREKERGASNGCE